MALSLATLTFDCSAKYESQYGVFLKIQALVYLKVIFQATI